MRKITKEAIGAFYNKGSFAKTNTEVYQGKNPFGDKVTVMALHNNEIAFLNHKTGRVSISNCGWFSVTTRERLNGLMGVAIHQKDFIWYLNGKEWNGRLTTI